MVVLNPNNSDSAGANVPEFTVSQLSGAIKRSLETGFAHVRVRAEVGRVTVPKSGHVYLDLKDDDAIISAIIWKGVAQTLQTPPTEGMEVIVTGRITTFAGQSKYQIIIEKLEPAGIGAILLQLEERRKRLAAEGLFDQSRKKPIPFLPRTIGVVTSPTGAVIRDILHRISERFATHILVWPVLVQGEKAAEQIAAAINGFNELANTNVPRPDLLIVARGGGSIEDLWAFNEEVVVRAAANSKIPLISAVGHETDTTLIDYAADLRAPTPTGAAEYAVPVRTELMAQVASFDARLKSGLNRRLNSSILELRAHLGAWPRKEVIIANARQKLDMADMRFAPALSNLLNRAKLEFSKIGSNLRPQLLRNDLANKKANLLAINSRLSASLLRNIKNAQTQNQQLLERVQNSFIALGRAINTKITAKAALLDGNSRALSVLSYQNVLSRGFALVLDKKGNIVKDIDAARSAKSVFIKFQDGEVGANIGPDKPIQGTLF